MTIIQQSDLYKATNSSHMVPSLKTVFILLLSTTLLACNKRNNGAEKDRTAIEGYTTGKITDPQCSNCSIEYFFTVLPIRL